MGNMEEARSKIEEYMKRNSAHTKDLIVFRLARVASESGPLAANVLIEEFGLEALYEIHPLEKNWKDYFRGEGEVS